MRYTVDTYMNKTLKFSCNHGIALKEQTEPRAMPLIDNYFRFIIVDFIFIIKMKNIIFSACYPSKCEKKFKIRSIREIKY